MGSTAPSVRDPVDFYLDHDGQGFHVVRHAAQDPACGHRTIWLARRELNGDSDD